MKSKRHERILEIIAKEEIETQEELVDALVAEGFKVTQATVSRDIKDLRLTKVPDERGGYKYTAIAANESGITPKMRQLFVNAVISIQPANNIVVIKTLTGSANTIATVVDAINDSSVLGSVAGDDTIILVVASNSLVEGVVEKLNSLLE